MIFTFSLNNIIIQNLIITFLNIHKNHIFNFFSEFYYLTSVIWIWRFQILFLKYERRTLILNCDLFLENFFLKNVDVSKLKLVRIVFELFNYWTNYNSFVIMTLEDMGIMMIIIWLYLLRNIYLPTFIIYTNYKMLKGLLI